MSSAAASIVPIGARRSEAYRFCGGKEIKIMQEFLRHLKTAAPQFFFPLFFEGGEVMFDVETAELMVLNSYSSVKYLLARILPLYGY